MRKRGQAQQVFIYIITMIVIGAIVLVGYKSIGGLMAKGCDVEVSNFASLIETQAEKYKAYGTYQNVTLQAPCDYDLLCVVGTEFIDTHRNDYRTSELLLPLGYPNSTHAGLREIVYRNAVDGIEQNVYLIKTGVVEPIGWMPGISGQGKCIEAQNNRFRIVYKGQGRTAELE